MKLSAEQRAKVEDSTLWKDFFTAIDVAYPDFAQKVGASADKLTEVDFRILYALKAGFTHADIASIIGSSRPTVTRKAKILERKLGESSMKELLVE